MTTQTRILIGSPVCQQPDVLRMFLFSLEKLSTSDMAVHYLFVDDNNDPASSRLLHHFAEKHSGQVEIIRSQEAPSTYSCNETTHIWTDELVWRVASFKNQLIERAKSGGYDGLFLLDSDLLLQPATLETLLASEKTSSRKFSGRVGRQTRCQFPRFGLRTSTRSMKSTIGWKASLPRNNTSESTPFMESCAFPACMKWAASALAP